MTLKSASASAEELDSSCASIATTSDVTSTPPSEMLRIPFSRGRKEVYDEDGNWLAELPTQDLQHNNINANIKDSNYITIGSPTHFHEPVTIIVNTPKIPEHQNGHLPKLDELICEKEGQLGITDAKPPPPKPYQFDLKSYLRKRPAQLWILALLLVATTITCLIVYFSVHFGLAHELNPVPPSRGHQDDLGNGIQVVQREEWLARPPLNVTKLTEPLKLVRICHTAGAFCSDYQSCTSKVQTIQGWLMGTQGLPDIAYNYLIGGDGNVYVGRGPDVVNEWMPSAIDIGYIGNYLGPFDKMTDKMEEAGKRLIEWLRKGEYITPDYKVVPQNQTTNSLSPGENIYKKIIKWPHYDKGLYF